MTDWTRLARPSLRDLTPYHPGLTRDELKERLGLDHLEPLNWNEDLFGPPQDVLDAAAAELRNAAASSTSWGGPKRSSFQLRGSRCSSPSRSLSSSRVWPG